MPLAGRAACQRPVSGCESMKAKYIYRSAAATDPGLQKAVNEDCYFDSAQLALHADLLQRLGFLYAVADGVSGQVGGEIASKIAIDTLRMYYVLPHVEIPPLDRLRNVFLEAHRRISAYAQEYPAYRGMGTTLTAMVLKNGSVYYGHVGDSRLYLIRNATHRMEQLTEDHSLVNKFVKEGKLTPEEAAEEDRNVLEQALGCVPHIHIDAGEDDALQPGDILLLASDGLTDMISDAKIRDVVLSSPSLAEASRRLITKANQHGGRDNITVILVGLEENPQE
jgi:serine/threonine protein phosphatase PrpC